MTVIPYYKHWHLLWVEVPRTARWWSQQCNWTPNPLYLCDINTLTKAVQLWSSPCFFGCQWQSTLSQWTSSFEIAISEGTWISLAVLPMGTTTIDAKLMTFGSTWGLLMAQTSNRGSHGSYTNIICITQKVVSKFMASLCEKGRLTTTISIPSTWSLKHYLEQYTQQVSTIQLRVRRRNTKCL